MVNQDIYVGDCRQQLGHVRDASVDLLITDPPYNIGVKYHPDYNDHQHRDRFLAYLHACLQACLPKLKKTGSVVVFMGPELQGHVQVLLRTLGLHWRNTVIWHYTFGQAQQKKFTPSWTAMHYFTRHRTRYVFNAAKIRIPSARQLLYKDKRANPQGKLPDDLWVLLTEHQVPDGFTAQMDAWRMSRVCGTFREREGYATQLPLPLTERWLTALTNPGDTVLDPFLGTGTTLIAAARLGRHGSGMELSRAVARRAHKRLREAGAHVTLHK